MKSFSNETPHFSSGSSGLPTFWIFPKLYKLCESCRRNPPETLKSNNFVHWRTMYL